MMMNFNSLFRFFSKPSAAAALTAATFALAPLAFADNPYGQLVTLRADTAFVPVGFDNNDDVTVVLEGYLPNACYRLTRAEYQIDPVALKINIQPFARFFDVPCMQSRVHFQLEVILGVLSAGNYEVTIGGQPAEFLSVGAAALPGPDDHFYAPVEETSVERNAEGQYVATLGGRFSNSCVKFVDIQVHNSGKTLEVLPIIEEVNDPAGCVEGEFAFKKQIILPSDMTAGRHLLHVRSLNGKAVNYLFTVK